MALPVRTYPAIDLAWAEPPDADAIDLLLADLDDDQPLAVVERDGGIRIFFSETAQRDRAADRVHLAAPAARCTSVEVPDENWAERSQAGLPPITVGRITVRTQASDTERASGLTPADVSPTSSSDVLLVIPASMGFGTGHHASTRLCLGLLQGIDAHGARVLDVGTGSGILAIAATRLGALSALGIDHDRDALIAAEESVEINQADARVSLATIDLARDPIAGAPFDVVFANLTGALLMRESARLARLVAPGGHLIASGFMVDEDDAVTRSLEEAGLVQAERTREDEWMGRRFTNPS